VNTATYTAPATIRMSAQASDSNGSVSRMDFYWGARRKLGSSRTVPYRFSWTNVPAGSDSLN